MRLPGREAALRPSINGAASAQGDSPNCSRHAAAKRPKTPGAKPVSPLQAESGERSVGCRDTSSGPPGKDCSTQITLPEAVGRTPYPSASRDTR
jgi:hypothetical protein